MQSAHLVDTNDARIPALGFGTFGLAGEECSQAVAHALSVGYRHLDTARMYGNEEAVGAGLRASGLPRDEVFVTTKVWWEDIAAGALERSAEASLGRLGLDRVDLLLIHWPNPAVSVREAIGALCNAKRRGFARHIGVSNFPTALLREAVAVADEPLAAHQVEYHPRLDQAAVLDATRRNGMALTSYCPLGRAALLDDPVVRTLADRHGRTPAQIVLRWHVQQPQVVAIPKSGRPERIAENFAIFDFALGEDDMAALARLARPDGRIVDPAFAPAWDRPAT